MCDHNPVCVWSADFYSWIETHSTDLFPGADVQPLHHFGKRALVDHLAHQVGPHPFGVWEAPQQLPGDLQGGQRRPLPAQAWALPLGQAVLAVAPTPCLRHHVLRSGLHCCCCWHPRQDPGPMWPPLTHTGSNPETGQSSYNTHSTLYTPDGAKPRKQILLYGQVWVHGCRLVVLPPFGNKIRYSTLSDGRFRLFFFVISP